MSDDELYYRQRIKEELAAADCADDVGVSQIHRDLAKRYRDLIGGDRPVDGTNGEPRALFG